MIFAGFGADCILRFGSDALKAKILPRIAQGKLITAGAFTEPDHGSDITCMHTTAEKNGDEWVLNGTKTFITNGSIAHLFLVLCQTNPECRPAHKGMSLVLVEADRPGISATDVGEKMGMRLLPTAESMVSTVRSMSREADCRMPENLT